MKFTDGGREAEEQELLNRRKAAALSIQIAKRQRGEGCLLKERVGEYVDQLGVEVWEQRAQAGGLIGRLFIVSLDGWSLGLKGVRQLNFGQRRRGAEALWCRWVSRRGLPTSGRTRTSFSGTWSG